ncbi:MAG: MBL fold metallo-hydrolase [Spirochaetaceae bacterium]|jgi:glyoxylase-like metal-dependent hydrolase (beta-lactamase superfamily II)|nr:MBL fold metallo-hydrolase [Spirochaetaceae bacterium]
METLTVGRLSTNCYIYPLESQNKNGLKNAALIDPGAEDDVIIAALEKNAFFPQYILLTHCHFDHILALSAVYNHYKQKPVIACAAAESEYIGEKSWEKHKKTLNFLSILTFIKEPPPFPNAGFIIEEGSSFGSLTAMLVPGHSPGSAAFYDKAAGILFSGDVLFASGVGRTDLAGGDQKSLKQSLSRLLALPGETLVFPGHGPSTTIAREQNTLLFF